MLAELKGKVAIGLVGGSDLSKMKEQIGPNGTFSFSFSFYTLNH